MTSEQKQVRDWMLKFGQECPEKPTIPTESTRRLRAKLIFEEAREAINALGFDIELDMYENVCDDHIVPHGEPNLELIADGCEDLKVVTEGTLAACGLISKRKVIGQGEGYLVYQACLTDPLFDEVMRSNNTKFWTLAEVESKLGLGTFTFKEVAPNKYLVKDKDGKVIKSPSYSPANLKPIIDSL